MAAACKNTYCKCLSKYRFAWIWDSFQHAFDKNLYSRAVALVGSRGPDSIVVSQSTKPPQVRSKKKVFNREPGPWKEPIYLAKSTNFPFWETPESRGPEARYCSILLMLRRSWWVCHQIYFSRKYKVYFACAFKSIWFSPMNFWSAALCKCGE